jgi:hypothetical protein
MSNNHNHNHTRRAMMQSDVHNIEQRFQRCGARLSSFTLWRFEHFNDEELTWLMKAEQAGRDRPRPEDKRRVKPPIKQS